MRTFVRVDRIEPTPAGFWYAWIVTLADGVEETVPLKFKQNPTEAEATALFQSIQAVEQARKDAEAAEQTDDVVRLGVIREGIMRYEAGQLTNAQSRNLLEAIIARLRKKGLV